MRILVRSRSNAQLGHAVAVLPRWISGKRRVRESSVRSGKGRERWKAVQKARRKGMSLRAIERELGIHRSTVRSFWRPEVLQDGSSGWRPIRRHRIPWQRKGVTFSLNTYPDIFPDLRQAGGTVFQRRNLSTIEPTTWPTLPPPFIPKPSPLRFARQTTASTRSRPDSEPASSPLNSTATVSPCWISDFRVSAVKSIVLRGTGPINPLLASRLPAREFVFPAHL